MKLKVFFNEEITMIFIFFIFPIVIISTLFFTSVYFSEIRSEYLIKNNRYSEAIWHLNKSIYENDDYVDKAKAYRKTMIICGVIENKIRSANYLFDDDDKSKYCNMYDISKHMYEQKNITKKANLYLALYSEDKSKYDEALQYLEPVKSYYKEEYRNIEKAKSEYNINSYYDDDIYEVEKKESLLINKDYTFDDAIVDFSKDAFEDLTTLDFDSVLSLDPRARGGKVAYKAIKFFRKWNNWEKRKKKILRGLKKLKIKLSNKKTYTYQRKISGHRSEFKKVNKDRLEEYKECVMVGHIDGCDIYLTQG